MIDVRSFKSYIQFMDRGGDSVVYVCWEGASCG